MGKSRKKSARKAADASAVIPPVKIAKQGKREAEDEAEKQVPKKQKKNDSLELAVEMPKVEEKILETVESISSPEKESVSEEEKAPIAQVVPQVGVKNGSVAALEEKNKAVGGSEEDPSNEHLDEDEKVVSSSSCSESNGSSEEDYVNGDNAPSKNTSAVSIMETQSNGRSDGDDSFEGKGDADENKKAMDVDTEDNEDGSDNNSGESDDEPQPQKMMPKTPATTQGDTKSKTLFVGNLSFNVEKADVENFFKDAGNVVEIRFASDHDGKFKGYGHVEFETPEAAQKALALNGESLLNRNVRLDLARERGSYTPHDSGDRSSFQKGGRTQTVYVKGFDASLGEDEARNLLQEHFSACGEITRIALPKDFESGSSKGFAYIDFKDGDSFNQALELNGSELGDGHLTVEEAKPRAEGGSGRGNGRDRDGGSFKGNGRGGRNGRGRGDRGRGRGRGRFGDSGGRFGGGRGNSGRGRGRGRGRGF